VDTARFVEHPALQSTVRPLIKGLLDASSITGPTAPLWVGVAGLAAEEDQASCGYYGVCDLTQQLTRAALPISHACDASHVIQAQALTPADLAAVCASLRGQDPFVQKLVKRSRPLPHQYESTVTFVVFASSTDYRTYAGALFGVGTDNGGITLTGDPTDPGNRPLSIVYQEPTDNGFTARVWNLNHEYTHDLDGRYDMLGDFTAETTVPDVWWIEGVAEYVSYTYRGVTDTGAVTEAAKHTYALSTLFQNTYGNSDVTRTYPWGYLAVRYMVEKHPSVVQQMLAHFRTGDYQGGYAVYHSLGTRYDAEFDRWLDACAAGGCARGHRV
jgi:microbial collagenase